MVSKFKRKAKASLLKNKSKLNNSSWHTPSYTSFQLDEERDEDYTTNAVGHNIKNDGGGDITNEREGEGLSIADEKANNDTTTESGSDTEAMWRSVYDMTQNAATIL